MKIYTAQMMYANGDNVSNGVTELTQVNGPVKLGVAWFTPFEPNALFATAPAQYQVLPPEIRGVPDFDGVGNGGEAFSVVRKQRGRRSALVNVTGKALTGNAARTFTGVPGWLTSVEYTYFPPVVLPNPPPLMLLPPSGFFPLPPPPPNVVTSFGAPIQYHFAPAHPIPSAPSIPAVSEEADFEGACIILRASDFRGSRRIEITGFGTAFVIGLWDDMSGSFGYDGPVPR